MKKSAVASVQRRYDEVISTQTDRGAYAVTLWQSKRNPANYAVTYGSDATSDMTYSEASTEYGSCVMHMAVCEGLMEAEE